MAVSMQSKCIRSSVPTRARSVRVEAVHGTHAEWMHYQPSSIWVDIIPERGTGLDLRSTSLFCKTGPVERAQIAAASFFAAALLVSPADAGVIMAKPDLKKVRTLNRACGSVLLCIMNSAATLPIGGIRIKGAEVCQSVS